MPPAAQNYRPAFVPSGTFTARPPSAPPPRPSTGTARRKMDEDKLLKLSTPKVPHVTKDVSALMSDVKECTFKPIISKHAKELNTSGKFLQRVPGYIARFKELQNLPPYKDKEATFKPQLNLDKTTVATYTARGAFLQRMKDDQANREKLRKELLAKARCPFQPVISESSKQRSSKISTPFLKRLLEDIDKRAAKAQERQQESMQIPFTFTPNTSKTQLPQYTPAVGPNYGTPAQTEEQKQNLSLMLSPRPLLRSSSPTSPPSFNSFLHRMLNDISAREDAFRRRNRMMRKKLAEVEPFNLFTASSHKRRHSSSSNSSSRSSLTRSASHRSFSLHGGAYSTGTRSAHVSAKSSPQSSPRRAKSAASTPRRHMSRASSEATLLSR